MRGGEWVAFITLQMLDSIQNIDARWPKKVEIHEIPRDLRHICFRLETCSWRNGRHDLQPENDHKMKTKVCGNFFHVQK